MSRQSERVTKLIQEHSSLNQPEAGSGNDSSEQTARVTEIRQELVKIFEDSSGK